MKKSKDITKYDLHWQVVRVEVKKLKVIDDKIKYVQAFYKKHNTSDNYERIMNWIEGLAMGYKDPKQKEKVISSKTLFKESTVKEVNIGGIEHIKTNVLSNANQYTTKQLSDCFIDNYTRFKKWSDSGYIHEELYNFCHSLLKYLTSRNIQVIVSKKIITLEQIENMYSVGKSQPNKYKFIFK